MDAALYDKVAQAVESRRNPDALVRLRAGAGLGRIVELLKRGASAHRAKCSAIPCACMDYRHEQVQA